MDTGNFSHVPSTGWDQIHPAVRDCIARGESAGGIDTRCLRSGDTVLVHTCNSTYILDLKHPAGGAAVASGDGAFIKRRSRVTVLGATLSGHGSLVKLGWLLIGFRMVLTVPGADIVTSPVRSLLVNNQPVVPTTGTH